MDRPLKVGGGIQPRLVTVLTPATTFTVGEDFIQNGPVVNRSTVIIYNFYLSVSLMTLYRCGQTYWYVAEMRRDTWTCSIRRKQQPDWHYFMARRFLTGDESLLEAGHTGQSSQLFPVARNAQLIWPAQNGAKDLTTVKVTRKGVFSRSH